jgi:para-nitrobenzyl esterase
MIAWVFILGAVSLAAEQVELTTSQGVLVGERAGGVAMFKGIPYAAPPVGTRRWRAPESASRWTGKRLATAFSPACAQEPYPTGSMFTRPSEPTSEDCLYLNVWSTNLEDGDKLLPVMVWIHGGGLTRGSGASSIYEGSALADKGVVVVSINYRLGPFGYLAHPALTKEAGERGMTASSGNYGTLDQVAALQWVAEHIAAFGGDPGNVTIFGESAGSWSVNHMTATPLAAGLFHKAIGQSGGKFDPMPELTRARGDVASAHMRGIEFATHLGVRTLSELRELTAAEIVAGFASFDGQGFSQPNVDGYVFPDHIANIFAEGKHNRVDLIVGSNADEGTNLMPPPKDKMAANDYLRNTARDRADSLLAAYRFDEDYKGAYYGAFRDLVFTWPMRQWASLASEHGDNVWLYYFTFVPPAPLDGKLGAYHAAEIRYAFDNAAVTFDGSPATQAELKLGDTMSDYWVNFAKTGTPSSDTGPQWPKFDVERASYLEIGDQIQAGQGGFLNDQLKQIAQVVADAWRRQQAVATSTGGD